MTELLRIEHDSMGAIEVPEKVLWGAQTQRSLKNFAIGSDQIPLELIYALAKIKQAAATANNRLGLLDKRKCELIVKASIEITQGLHNEQFPLSVWQTGSGTQTNMNMNEVISNLASINSNEPLGSHKPVHPNDHVNQSQSTNDTFPAAIHVASVQAITQNLLPELNKLIEVFARKSNEWQKIIKIGRTHLQDAVPLTLGQEASAWRDQVSTAKTRIELALTELYLLPIGGTAVGTGLNTHENFDKEAIKELSEITGIPFTPAPNKFAVMASHDGLVHAMSELKLLAVSLLKVINDIRLLSCGPRAGIAELQLPANEPGSSIMPGKVNPTQCEAMAMVCTQVIGLDAAVSIAGSGGHLQMNSFKPLIGFNLLKTIELLHDACFSCRVSMLEGLKPNQSIIQNNLDQSLMLITSLTPIIGYEKSSEIAQYAHSKEISLKQAAIKLGYINETDFDKFVDPKQMISPNSNSNT